MRRVSGFVMLLCWLALCGLLAYELVQKSADSPLGPLPGYTEARTAERVVRYRAVTGLGMLDRLLHEGEEACCYYRDLAVGSFVTSPAPPAGVPRGRAGYPDTPHAATQAAFPAPPPP